MVAESTDLQHHRPADERDLHDRRDHRAARLAGLPLATTPFIGFGNPVFQDSVVEYDSLPATCVPEHSQTADGVEAGGENVMIDM